MVLALRDGAAVLERPDVRTLRLVGPDRVRFLNGMISNDVETLVPGAGMIAVKTSNRGRVEGVLRVRASAEYLEMELLEVVADKVRQTLSKFIIMDDCAISDVSASRDVAAIYGKDAASVLSRAGLAPPSPELAPHAFFSRPDGVVIIREAMLGLDGYELQAPAGQGAAIVQRLLDAGARRASWPDLDVARVEAGVPLDGRELDEDTIPMEARLERALDMKKGCYVGQEVIARATNLGGVKHIMVGLVFSGEAPVAAETPLFSGETRTGEVCSVVYSPALSAHIGLGFVFKKDEAVGTKLIARSASGAGVEGVVHALPFVTR